MKTIHSPEGVSLLMENIWLRHKTGMKQRQSNIYPKIRKQSQWQSQLQ